MPDDDFTYGKALKPSTPIKNVLGNTYGDIAEQSMITRYEFIRLNESRDRKTRLKSADRHTRASALAKTFITTRAINESYTGAKPLFKMKKF